MENKRYTPTFMEMTMGRQGGQYVWLACLGYGTNSREALDEAKAAVDEYLKKAGIDKDSVVLRYNKQYDSFYLQVKNEN